MRQKTSLFLLSLCYIYQTSFAATIQNAYITSNNLNSTLAPAPNPLTPLPPPHPQNLTQTYYHFLPNGNLLQLETTTHKLPLTETLSVLLRASKSLGKKPSTHPLAPREKFEIGADRTAEPHNEADFVVEPIYEQRFTWGDALATVDGLKEWFEEVGVDRSFTTYFYYQGVTAGGVLRTLGYGAVKKVWQPFPPGMGM
ncbi:hypothetical protein N7G274_001280 [Stereocaulon virgatum]|uniref:Uncharacterized protein n=1 Tax=Stereocaulon virgatum TaxID=373712 RepID=A0ABR4ANZ7_9LECA